jgi:formylglycine-generating enzyme required for sulfatase activity
LNEFESIDLGGGIKMEFVLIKPGSFIMGNDMDLGDGDETPMHKVTITKPFYLGKYEVTQEQWQELMGSNPSEFKGVKLPVDTVSWNDCQSFLSKLQRKIGKKFTLPTEAQWEYACRAGTTTIWNLGNSSTLLEDYAWIDSNSGKVTHPVGSKKPNTWGLYDMYGNVQEWCADWYATPYTLGDVTDPKGPSHGDSRILRGGAWGDSPVNVRSAYRNCNGADGKNNGIGFRCEMPY